MRNTNSRKNRLLILALIFAVAVCFTFSPQLWGRGSADSAYAAETAANTDSQTGQTESSGNSGDSSQIADGTYVPSGFTFTGGTGKVSITCTYVRVKDGSAEALIVFHSAYYTKMTVNGKSYSAKVDKDAGTASFTVPVLPNQDTEVSATTTRMGAPHDIAYTLRVELKGTLKPYSSGSDSGSGSKSDSDNGSGSSSKSDSNSGSSSSGTFDYDKAIDLKSTAAEKAREASYFKDGKLKDGTYRVQAWTDHRMFNIQPYKNGTYAILTVKNGKMKAALTLTGQGYDYLYAGTKAQAEKASKSKWSRYKSTRNYYSYVIPVKSLNKKFALSGHSKRENRWYEHTAVIYTAKMKKVSATATNIPGNTNSDKTRSNTSGSNSQKTFVNDHKKDTVSKSVKDTSGSTSKVDRTANRRDGVYTPSSFSWSGGSGRLKGISCSKITVTGGKAYATIVFNSPNYDQLRADGRTFMRSAGGSTSTFVIPVRLNANNTVVARTVAMSQPHWVTYTLYVGLNGRGGSSSSQLKSGQKKLSAKAPEIAGLTKKSEVKVKNAKLFKIFSYSKGVTLIEVDMQKYTESRKAVGYKERKTKVTEDRDEIQKKEGKTQSERTQELYKGEVINYLIVPRGVSVPAGLDKTCVIIRTPERGYTASQSALKYAGALNQAGRFTSFGFSEKTALSLLPATQADALETRADKDKVYFPGTWKSVDYRDLVEAEADLCILPSGSLPKQTDNLDEVVSTTMKSTGETSEDNSGAAEHPVKHFFASILGLIPESAAPSGIRAFVQKYDPAAYEDGESESGAETVKMTARQRAQQQYRSLDGAIQLFTAMETPVLIDRSAREKGKLAQAEWVKVYGALLGSEDEAQSWYANYVRANSK